MGTSLKSLIYPRQGRSVRQSSFDRTGGNKDYYVIEAGEEKVVFEMQGPAQINHIWMTVYSKVPYYLRRVLIRMQWDDESTPSVECPLGDFYGVGHGVASHYMSLPLNMVTKQGPPQIYAAMNCFFAMPFQKHGKVTIVNQTGAEMGLYFYFDCEMSPGWKEEPLTFHAWWNRQNPTDGIVDMQQLKRVVGESVDEIRKFPELKNTDGTGNYLILSAEGRGHYVGCNLSIDHINPVPNITWFGEGDDMFFIDGEPWPPSLHGTGTEDYFCAAWDYPAGKYDGPYHGISLAQPVVAPTAWDEPGFWGVGSYAYSGKWTTYRFHIEDPVIFRKSLLFSIEHGHANSLSNDYSSTAYWYQTEPHKPFPVILAPELRLPLATKESLQKYTLSI
jgi:hypothetical protein